VNTHFRTTPLYWLITIAMWVVLISAFLGAATPFVLRLLHLTMFCDSCATIGDVLDTLLTIGGASLIIILLTAAAAMFIWHAANWPYVVLAPLLVAGVFAGSARHTIHEWFWWLGL
jgi:hypothetical protein